MEAKIYKDSVTCTIDKMAFYTSASAVPSYLLKPSFPHVQLYVSVSRATFRRGLKVLALQKQETSSY